MSWSLSLPMFSASLSNTSGDRFIPSRARAAWGLNFYSKDDSERLPNLTPQTQDSTLGSKKSELVYSALLKNELLGAGIQKFQDPKIEDRELYLEQNKKNLFTYSYNMSHRNYNTNSEVSPYALSPLSNESQTLLTSVRQFPRNISKKPFKILRAPDLCDDFYLNLLDWSRLNVVTVGLGTCVYLWNATTSQIFKLCDLFVEDDFVTSVNWYERGFLLAVGTHRGFVQIWDVIAQKKVITLQGHTGRVSSLAWNGDQISSGSRDRNILQRDIRTYSPHSQRKLKGHKQEVCGLRWSPDHQLLASGGNDNRLQIWNSHSLKPFQQYTNHKAAVKALAWSPHQHGLLASGGGSSDCCICFWNILRGHPLQCIDTGSQVCNLAWSKQDNEMVSTHGYSENHIIIWKYPSMNQVDKLPGHSYRVLYMALSPDGQNIVTGSGDKRLRFWNIFRKAHSEKKSACALNLFTRIR